MTTVRASEAPDQPDIATSTLLTVPEVAAQLRVDPATVRRWITAGTIPAVKVGRSYRVEADQVRAVIDRSRTSTPLTTAPRGTLVTS